MKIDHSAHFWKQPYSTTAMGLLVLMVTAVGWNGRVDAKRPMDVTVDDRTITFSDLPEAPVSYPVSVPLSELPALPKTVGLRVQGESPRIVPAQSDGEKLWWKMPTSADANASFEIVAAESPSRDLVHLEKEERGYTFSEGSNPIMKYRFGMVPLPANRQPHHFADGREYGGPRSDYLHPVYGPNGEILTDDYPGDHPHHRGIWWSWPVTRYGDQVADIWAVSGVRAFPEEITKRQAGPVFAMLSAVHLWKFGEEKIPIVRQEATFQAFRRGPTGRVVDVTLALYALKEGVAIGGRPKGGYGGFSLRAAPASGQKITTHADPPDAASSRAAWMDYTARFDGESPSGITMIEGPTNPGWPNAFLTYPNLNCMMPAFPGDREFPLEKAAGPDDPPSLVLKHRLWIHAGTPTEAMLRTLFEAYRRFSFE